MPKSYLRILKLAASIVRLHISSKKIKYMYMACGKVQSCNLALQDGTPLKDVEDFN